MRRTAVALSWLAGLLAAGVALAAPVRVLHVSAFGYDELRRILAANELAEPFAIDMVTLDEGLPDGWMEYDVIVFGLSDTFETRAGQAIERLPELRWYVLNGGGIVWTHDTLEYGGSWGEDVEEPAGVAEVGAPRLGMDLGRLRIEADHPVLRALADVGQPGDLLASTRLAGFAHSGGGRTTTAEVVVGHDLPEADNNFYLTVHQYGRGRVVVDEIGHSVIGYEGDLHPEQDPSEVKLLANAMFWAGRGVSNTAPALLQTPRIILRPGDSRRVTARGDRLTWTSSRPAVAGVEPDGTLQAHQPGFTTLIVGGPGGATDSLVVYVTEDGSDPTRHESVQAFGRRLKLPFRGPSVRKQAE